MSQDRASSPCVSVLVTVFNRADFLADCLSSLIASSWTDFEAIVVDDASTDSSADIAEDFAARDSRIRPFRNPANLGDYGNRMRAASLARGKYLKYLDSDDIIYEHGLGVMVQGMEKNPEARLGLSHSVADSALPYPFRLTPEEAWRMEFLEGGALGCGPSGAILRRDAFSEIGGFRDWGVLNDTDLWYRMSARWPVVLFPPALVWWRRHPGQEFSRDDSAGVYLEKGFALCGEALASPDCPLSREDRVAARERAGQHYARKLLSLAIRKRRPGEAVRLMRRSGLSFGDVVSGFSAYR